jgi:hypothetical protein
MNRRSALGLLLSTPYVAHAGRTTDDPDYAEHCRLPDGVAVKRTPAPFPPERAAFLRARSAIPDASETPDGAIMLQKADGALQVKLNQHGGPLRLQLLLQFGLDLSAHEYLVTTRLKQVELPGDWTFRENAPLERKVEDFQRALREKLMPEVSLSFKDVERKAMVAHGTYRFAPVAKDGECIEIFGDYYEEGSKRRPMQGTFEAFLRAAARRIGAPLVNEAKETPAGTIRWRSHVDLRPRKGVERRGPDSSLVLENLAKQTGLEFKEEKRMLKTLVIEETPAK